MRKTLALTLVLVTGCGVFGASDDTTEAPNPPPGGLPPDAPPPVTGTPLDEELTEKFGVFVTPAGTPDGDGSRFKPVGTIDQGISLAKAKFLRVYVCTGLYKDPVTLESGISVIGGYDCTNPNGWKTGAPRSRLEPTKNPAMVARNIDKTTRFEGFDVLAGPGVVGSPSSIALLAENAGSLTIANAKLASGKGLDGEKGKEPVQLTPQFTSPGIGKLASSYVCPPLTTCQRVDGGLKTFPGGSAGSVVCAGEPGHDPEAGGAGGSGGVYWYTSGYNAWTIYNGLSNEVALPGEAKSGGNGTEGVDGTLESAGFSPVDGYKPGNGTPGTSGLPGKGGKGGNGAPPNPVSYNLNEAWIGNAGSGGGAGGCPGLAGTPGKGGGASIGALLFGSAITFDNVEIIAGDGGAGGRGSLGSEASTGGQPGAIQSTVNATRGAAGGAGGRAGISGSGVGGPSFGVGFFGGAPKLVNGSSAKKGAPGAGVPEESVPQDPAGNARTLPATREGAALDMADFDNMSG